MTESCWAESPYPIYPAYFQAVAHVRYSIAATTARTSIPVLDGQIFENAHESKQDKTRKAKWESCLQLENKSVKRNGAESYD